MPLNKEGIEQLKADLRASAKLYNQDTFGSVTDCGTELCMAGMCLLREVGPQKYKEISTQGPLLAEACLAAGERQLGIETDRFPTIFASADNWPEDLNEKYDSAKDGASRVVAACEALDRLQLDGSIVELWEAR